MSTARVPSQLLPLQASLLGSGAKGERGRCHSCFGTHSFFVYCVVSDSFGVSIWPIFGLLTPPMLLVLFLGFVFTANLIPALP